MSNKCTSNDNIDNLAQSFFITLIFCALLNDSYSIINNFFNTEYIQKKMKYGNYILTAIKYIFTNDYEKDKRGNIVIKKILNEKDNICKKIEGIIKENPIEVLQQKKEEIKEKISNIVNNISHKIIEEDNVKNLEVESNIYMNIEKKEKEKEVVEEQEIIEKKVHKVKKDKEHKKNIKEEKFRKIKSTMSTDTQK